MATRIEGVGVSEAVASIDDVVGRDGGSAVEIVVILEDKLVIFESEVDRILYVVCVVNLTT